MSDPTAPPAAPAVEPGDFAPCHQSAQTLLKTQLLADKTGKVLERLAAALYGALLGVPILVAISGFQHGGDAGPAGRAGRRFRLETKRYAETTQLSERELLGEIDHALARDLALEAWVLVATRPVGEQLGQSLMQKGESIGVPVLIVAWEEGGLASLAALCASNPAIVGNLVNAEAGAAARILAEISGPAIAALRRDMASWNLGFEAIRVASYARFERVWTEPRVAQSDYGQDVAAGARPHRVGRQRAKLQFDAWLSKPQVDAPLVAFGAEGVGKTWAVIDWLHDGHLAGTILLSFPASAVPAVGPGGERTVKRLLAERLCELTGVREMGYWERRIDKLLARPTEEGPAFTLFLDGVNEAPSVPWLPLLKALQGPTFAGRVRVIVSSRETYLREKLGHLRGLAIPAHFAEIDIYDLEPGGEFDTMLAQEGLSRADLDPDLIKLARTPRLFGLTVGLRGRLAAKGQVTVHRLLWEYGRDAFGIRAGRSFSEPEWHEWLAEIARRWRGGSPPTDRRTLGETVARADLAPEDVQARLSDVIDGRFFAGPPGEMALSPAIVAHALGAALLDNLSRSATDDAALLQEELAAWLEPVDGLDQRAELLRAAVSIGIERDVPAGPAVLGILVTAWLQSQNVDEHHLFEISRIAHELVGPLLDAVERSDEAAQRTARLAATNALRAVSRDDGAALRLIVQRGQDWFRHASLRRMGIGDADREERARKRLRGLLGTDVEGPVTVLAANIVLGDHRHVGAAMQLPALLEGFPLATATDLFEAAALHLAIAGSCEAQDGLRWLCLLNEVDAVATREALRTAAQAVRVRVTETGVDRRLPDRVAALLLRFTGYEADETEAVRIDPRLEDGIDYEAHYLSDPGTSMLPLERRHASAVLEDPTVSSGSKITRAADFFLDPTFGPPSGFAAECRRALEGLDPADLGRERSVSNADHRFQVWQPALARMDPQFLAEFCRRKLGALASATSVQRHWAAVHAVEPYVLSDEDSARAAAALRLSSREVDQHDEAFVSGRMFLLELRGLPAFDQACALIDANLAYIDIELVEVVEPLAPGDAERLIDLYGKGTEDQCRALLFILSIGSASLAERAWSWIQDLAAGGTGDLKGFAFEVLAGRDPGRLGAWLDERDWSWASNQHIWCNYWGSIALAEATRGSPFVIVAPRLAPAVLLATTRARGSDPTEIRLAAEILDSVFRRNLPVPDPGADVSVDKSRRRDGPTEFSLALKDATHVGVDIKKAIQPVDSDSRQEWARRTAATAYARIRRAQAEGADLYLVHVLPDDMREAIRHAPDVVASWLKGAADATPSFKKQVRLAEGAYLALCEALLAEDPARGVTLWWGLRAALSTRYLGDGGVDELIHLVFRAPQSPEVEAHLEILREPGNSPTDRAIADLVYAARCNGRADWAEKWQQDDADSTLPWRQRRAIMVGGFSAGGALPVEDAWPAGLPGTSFDTLRTSMARLRWRDACARHWWRAFVAATDPISAYSSWVLYHATADGRDDAPIGEDRPDSATEFGRLKAAHVTLNSRDLRRRRDKASGSRKELFLGRRICQAFGPWSD